MHGNSEKPGEGVDFSPRGKWVECASNTIIAKFLMRMILK